MTPADSSLPAKDAPADVPLTTITALVSRGGQEKFAAEAFTRAFGADQARAEHQSALLIQQAGGVSFLISRFSGPAALARWRASECYQQMIAGFEAHALRDLRTLEQPIVRIVVPSAESGAKWKTLIASQVVTFPLLLFIVQTLNTLLPNAPLVVNVGLTSILMASAIAWVIAPFIARVTRIWRLRDQQMQIVVIADAALAAAPGPAAPPSA